MRLGNVVDEFLDEHRLAHAGAAEQADLAALQVRLQQVYDLDAREEHLLGGGEVLELGSLAVDGQGFVAVQLSHSVNGVSGHVHHAAANLRAHGHGDGPEGVLHFQTAAEAVRGVHGNAAHGVFTNVLLHLQDKGFPVRALHRKGVFNSGEFQLRIAGRYIEMHIHHRSYDLRDVPDCMGHRLKKFQYPQR